MLELIWALGAIILIDVVLGGENALVIAMAANKLPEHLRRKAMLWGTFGAVAVRFASVAALTYLLMIPGLRLVGGIALMYIAYKLVTSEEDELMKTATPYPETEKDLAFQKRVDFWKNKVDEILVSPFNYNTWGTV